MNYYILTSQKKKRVLISQHMQNCFDFIINNYDVKIRTIDYKAKPKILRKEDFLMHYYTSAEDVNKLFFLMENIIKGKPNRDRFIRNNNLKDLYSEHIKSNHKTI